MRKIVLVGVLLYIALLCPQKNLAATENEVTVESFSLFIRKDATSKAEALKNVKVNIYGANSETKEQFLLKTTSSDSNGKVSMKKMTASKEIDKIHFQYYFGNDDRGYIISSKNTKYNANHTRVIPSNRIVNATRVTSILGTEVLNSEFYSKITSINNIYQDVYLNQKFAVEKAKPYIDTTKVEFKPIDIIYDKTLDILGGGFFRHGYGDRIKNSVILLKDTTDFKPGVVHEWAHWNMYRVNGMPGGSYKTHHDQVNPYVSYKEGWALFQRHQFTCGLENELANETQVQDDSRLFGVSTNYTVKGALYDIYDMNFPKNQLKEKDEFDVYTAFVNGTHSVAEKDLISEGLMYTLMVNSKASTFQEFYTYLMNTHIVNHPDKSLKGKLEQAMKNNGIEKDGGFVHSASKVATHTEVIDPIENEVEDMEEH